MALFRFGRSLDFDSFVFGLGLCNRGGLAFRARLAFFFRNLILQIFYHLRDLSGFRHEFHAIFLLLVLDLRFHSGSVLDLTLIYPF